METTVRTLNPRFGDRRIMFATDGQTTRVDAEDIAAVLAGIGGFFGGGGNSQNAKSDDDAPTRPAPDSQKNNTGILLAVGGGVVLLFAIGASLLGASSKGGAK